jgi:glucoamylase
MIGSQMPLSSPQDAQGPALTAAVAPGEPGMRPTWTSSAKDMVTTAIDTSRVWVTLGHGILNEVYWPATGRPQIRDLGFIVSGPFGWVELKRVAQYRISMPEHYVPLPQIVHEGEGYRLELEVATDPLRDAVLISFRLSGAGTRLYALLAPHLGNSGVDNNARADGELLAWKGDNALCLSCDCGFSRTSAGYVGSSDGWQDFFHNGRMAWSFAEAPMGNVALTGELGANEGTLALGISGTLDGARTLARSSLSEGYGAIRERFVACWEDWGQKLVIPECPPAVEHEAYISAVVLKVHQDRTFAGSIVASLSVPWGNANDSSGGYHLVWARDCVEAGLALVAVGQVDEARAMLAYLMAIQADDGRWNQNSFPDGHPFWTGIQLDEVGFPVLLASKLAEEDALAGMNGVEAMVQRAVAYLVRNGPISAQDRWEENAGFSPFTLGIQIAALIAAGPFLAQDERDFCLSLADYWNERIEDWTYAVQGVLAQQYGVDGYYVRIGPTATDQGMRGRVEIKNRWGETVPASALIGMEYLYLARLGLRDPNDPRIQNTLKVAEALLKVEMPTGVAYRRYNGDGYGEHEDGSPFDGTGIGRPWPLLAGERGHFDLLLGRDPLPWLETMARMTGPGGLIPEQVWDGPAMPEHGLIPGKPSGSAMPLVWAHAEFLKLLAARQQKRPLEQLDSVDEHLREKSADAGTWHWRPDTPFDTLPKNRDLLIDLPVPFVLHLGFDGWQANEDRPSTRLPFGRYGVRLARQDLASHKIVDFTVYFVDEARWDGRDYHVQLAT